MEKCLKIWRHIPDREFHYSVTQAQVSSTISSLLDETPHSGQFCQTRYGAATARMNISLSDSMKAFVDQQVRTRGYATSSENVRELIRKDRDIQRMRSLLLDSATSPAGSPVNAGYFEGLREHVRRRAAS